MRNVQFVRKSHRRTGRKMLFTGRIRAVFVTLILFSTFITLQFLTSVSKELLQSILQKLKDLQAESRSHISKDDGNLKVLPSHPYWSILFFDKKISFLKEKARHFFNETKELAFTTRHRKLSLEVLLAFDHVWRKKLNHTYFLYAGTLLGAYRHGQLVPWDDDTEILIDVKHNKTLVELFRGSNLAITTASNFLKKMFLRNSTTDSGFRQTIDILFYEFRSNGSEIEVVGQDFVFPSKFVFPTIPIPYEGHTFLGPRCPPKIIKITFGHDALKMCCSRVPKQKAKTSDNISTCVHCTLLFGIFNFLRWKRINSTHSQQITFEPFFPQNTTKKSISIVWKDGPTIFMPEC